MKLALTSFEALKQETRDVLVRCADHGAATTTTLARMVLCKSLKSAAGNPSLQNSRSRIQPRSARRRIELLMTAGILERRVISMGNGTAPVWSVVPNRTHPAMAFAAVPHGGLDDALLRSMLAAALVDIGFAVGRDPETIEMFRGQPGRRASTAAFIVARPACWARITASRHRRCTRTASSCRTWGHRRSRRTWPSGTGRTTRWSGAWSGSTMAGRWQDSGQRSQFWRSCRRTRG